MSLALFVVFFACLASAQTTTSSGPGYTYFCTGNCTDIVTPMSGGMVFMGGGTDVDDAYKWLIQQAGGGNIVILRTGPPGDDAYNPYIYGLGKCHSVATLIINDTIANQQAFVIDQINRAEALYFAGGDQSTYYNIWGTEESGKITQAINARVAQSCPVGGTSAGMAVLASYPFTAETGGVDSTEALMLPLDADITLADDMLSLHSALVGPLTTDMHFVVRDRMGRLIGFLANGIHRQWKPARGFACNERTAFLLDTNTGVGTLVGDGPAFALSYQNVPEVLEKETPLTWSNITCQRLVTGDSFDFNQWTGGSTEAYMLHVNDGDLSSTGNNGNIY